MNYVKKTQIPFYCNVIVPVLSLLQKKLPLPQHSMEKKRKRILKHNLEETYFFSSEIDRTHEGRFVYSDNNHIVYDRFLSQVILLSSEEAKALQLAGKHSNEHINKTLYENGLLFESRELSIPDDAKEFEIWLQVVNHCNLRCMGCATGMDVGQDRKKNIDKEAIRPYFTKIFGDAREKGFSKVKVKMGGGEPTLAGATWIAELSKVSREMADRYGMQLEINLLTNGLVSYDVLLEVLKIHDIGVSVSLDPERLVPGTTRPITDLVKRNLEKLVAKDIACSGQFTIYSNNLQHLIPFYEYTCSLGINMVWGLFRHQNKEQMKYNRFEDLAPALEALYVKHYERMKEGKYYGQIHSFDYLDIRGYKDAVCGAGDTYVVLDWNGDIYTCHESIRRGNPLARCSDSANIFDSIRSGFPVKHRLNSDIKGNGIFDNQGGKGCHWVRESETNTFEESSTNTQRINDFVGGMLVALNVAKGRKEGLLT